MRFAFIQTQLASTEAAQLHWSAGILCRILGVSRSGYWACQRRQRQPLSEIQQSKRQAESRLRLQIRAAHRKGRCYYGSPRVQDELRDLGILGIHVSRKRVARLMREEGLVGRSRVRRCVQTTDSRYSYQVANNLLERRFTPQQVARPNRFMVWRHHLFADCQRVGLPCYGQRLILTTCLGLGAR